MLNDPLQSNMGSTPSSEPYNYGIGSGPVARVHTPQDFNQVVRQQEFDNSTIWGAALSYAFTETYGTGSFMRAATTDTGVRRVNEEEGTVFRNQRTFRDETIEEMADRGAVPISKEQWRGSAAYRDGLTWDPSWTRARAEDLADWYDIQRKREFKMKDSTWISLGAGFIGNVPDPLNWVPILGPAFRAWAVGRAAVLTGRTGQVLGGAATTSVDAAANTLAMGLATKEMRGEYGDDVSWQTMGIEIAVSALFGVAIGGVAGKYVERKVARAQKKKDAADAVTEILIDELADIDTAQKAVEVLKDAHASVEATGEIRLSPEATKIASETRQKVEKFGGGEKINDAFIDAQWKKANTTAAKTIATTQRVISRLIKEIISAKNVIETPELKVEVQKSIDELTSQLKVDRAEIKKIKADGGDLGDKPKLLKANETHLKSLRSMINPKTIVANEKKLAVQQAKLAKLAAKAGPQKDKIRRDLAEKYGDTADVAKGSDTHQKPTSSQPAKTVDDPNSAPTIRDPSIDKVDYDIGTPEGPERMEKNLGLEDYDDIVDVVDAMNKNDELTYDQKKELDDVDDINKKDDKLGETLMAYTACMVANDG